MKRVKTGNAFIRSERGAVAAEFALIAPIFIALILAIVEFGIVYTRFNIIADSVEETARVMKTGRQFNTPTSTCADETACFLEYFCDGVDELVTCSPGVNFSYDVVSYATFQELAADNTSLPCPTDQGGGQAPGASPPYDAGVSSSIMRIRVCYELPVINPYLGVAFPQTGSGNLKFLRTMIFANEPYGAPNTPGGGANGSGGGNGSSSGGGGSGGGNGSEGGGDYPYGGS